MAISFKGAHFPQDIILMGVRWYVAYPLSTRHVEELMAERGVEVDHPRSTAGSSSTARNWRRRSTAASGPSGSVGGWMRPISRSKGEWRYLYRAVDKQGQTIDFLLTEQRDEEAALRFLTRRSAAMACRRRSRLTGAQRMQRRSRATTQEHGTTIAIRKSKYLNNSVEQDHRGVKRVTGRCWGSKRLMRRSQPSSASNSCTCCAKGSWKTRSSRASLRPNSSTLWPRNPLTDRGNCPLRTF